MLSTRMAIPHISIAQIENDISECRTKPTATEQWMSKRAIKDIDRMGERSADMRYAFEAGYRRGAEVRMTFYALLAGIIGIVELARYLAG